MKVNIEIKEGELEVFEVIKEGQGWIPAKDKDNPELNGPAIDINNTFSPPLEMLPGSYWLIKVNT